MDGIGGTVGESFDRRVWLCLATLAALQQWTVTRMWLGVLGFWAHALQYRRCVFSFLADTYRRLHGKGLARKVRLEGEAILNTWGDRIILA